MGKIMMNGVQYGVGGIEKAKDISYDNTSSGMSATNVQGALDEVKAGLKPVLIGESAEWSGDASAQILPTITLTQSIMNFSEIFIVVFLNRTDYWSESVPIALFNNLPVYVNVSLIQGEPTGVVRILANSNQTMSVNYFSTTAPAWYAVPKKVYVFGRK